MLSRLFCIREQSFCLQAGSISFHWKPPSGPCALWPCLTALVASDDWGFVRGSFELGPPGTRGLVSIMGPAHSYNDISTQRHSRFRCTSHVGLFVFFAMFSFLFLGSWTCSSVFQVNHKCLNIQGWK